MEKRKDEYILLANNKKIKKYSIEYLIWFYSDKREEEKEEEEEERTKRALKLKPRPEPTKKKKIKRKI
ncbi:TPA: hypothetical protein ACI4AV_003782 [Proteus mirabilis]